MARTNLHELANRLLDALRQASENSVFEGKLREVAADAGLNSVRSAEAVKLLEDLGRIHVTQRGRRGRDTIIEIRSEEAVTLEDAEAMMPSRAARRTSKVTYDEIGQATVDRLIELGRDDALRTAQVEAFAAENASHRERVAELEGQLEQAAERETDLRIKLKTAEEALIRAEENLRKAFGPPRAPGEGGAPTGTPVQGDDERALLDILRSGRS